MSIWQSIAPLSRTRVNPRCSNDFEVSCFETCAVRRRASCEYVKRYLHMTLLFVWQISFFTCRQRTTGSNDPCEQWRARGSPHSHDLLQLASAQPIPSSRFMAGHDFALWNHRLLFTTSSYLSLFFSYCRTSCNVPNSELLVAIWKESPTTVFLLTRLSLNTMFLPATKFAPFSKSHFRFGLPLEWHICM